jgi:hypothetical protein
MKDAITELKLPSSVGNDGPMYGQNVEVKQQSSPETESGEIWDWVSNEDLDNYQIDITASPDLLRADGDLPVTEYGEDWLHQQCLAFSKRRTGIEATELFEQLRALLVSDSNSKISHPILHDFMPTICS